MTTIKLTKIRKGDYSVIINGIEVEINKQYSSKNYVAQSICGTIDFECDTLKDIKSKLELFVK